MVAETVIAARTVNVAIENVAVMTEEIGVRKDAKIDVKNVEKKEEKNVEKSAGKKDAKIEETIEEIVIALVMTDSLFADVGTAVLMSATDETDAVRPAAVKTNKCF